MKKNIKYFRNYLTSNNLDAYIIPNSDPHNSEYLNPHHQVNQWLTGFSGSAATVIISNWHIGLWTDSRYYLQADQELADSGIELHKTGSPDDDSPLLWVERNRDNIKQVGIDYKMWTQAAVAEMLSKLNVLGVQLLNTNPLGEVWPDRPTLPVGKIFIHRSPYTKRSAADKVNLVRRAMANAHVDSLVINTLDDIAWLLNIRGFDNDYSPTVFAYCILSTHATQLFIDEKKLNNESITYLSNNSISINDYEEFESALSQLNVATVWLDFNQINFTIYQSLSDLEIINSSNPISLLKSQKTKHEIKNIENAMQKDGVALVRAFMQLEENIDKSLLTTEFKFVTILQEERSKEKGYHSNSFDAIVGYGGNGAIVHYRPEEKKSAVILSEGILLCDSGAQYIDGTTDITRTIKLGPVSQDMMDHFTLVLKGHIALATMEFPIGTTGHQLDAIARQYLWKHGLDYGHGTGHGVGYFLGVHEGPQNFSPRIGSAGSAVIKAGMFTSNEPGYYKAGAYGIRLENLMVAEPAEQSNFLQHRTLTLFPFDVNLINLDMMTEIEIQWLNEYHSMVLKRLEPKLGRNGKDWLIKKCKAL